MQEKQHTFHLAKHLARLALVLACSLAREECEDELFGAVGLHERRKGLGGRERVVDMDDAVLVFLHPNRAAAKETLGVSVSSSAPSTRPPHLFPRSQTTPS